MSRDTLAVIEVLTELRDAAHETARSKGFWDEGERSVTVGTFPLQTETVKQRPANMGEKIALMHSELSEWLEALRKKNPPCEKPIDVVADGQTRRITAEEEEVADLFIRMLDVCGYRGIDLGRVTLAKMAYNAGRPHMHGKSC